MAVTESWTVVLFGPWLVVVTGLWAELMTEPLVEMQFGPEPWVAIQPGVWAAGVQVWVQAWLGLLSVSEAEVVIQPPLEVVTGAKVWTGDVIHLSPELVDEPSVVAGAEMDAWVVVWAAGTEG